MVSLWRLGKTKTGSKVARNIPNPVCNICSSRMSKSVCTGGRIDCSLVKTSAELATIMLDTMQESTDPASTALALLTGESLLRIRDRRESLGRRSHLDCRTLADVRDRSKVWHLVPVVGDVESLSRRRITVALSDVVQEPVNLSRRVRRVVIRKLMTKSL